MTLTRLGWQEEEAARVGLSELGQLYSSAQFLELERRRLFARSWALVASGDELGPGRYLTQTVGGVPLVVLRRRDGALRAYHNLCRHRGLPLLEGSGELGSIITCPYHQWSFGVDGSLVRVPQQEEQFCDLDRRAWGLRPAPVSEWHGMVMVNPADDAGSLSQTLGGLDGRLEHFLAGGGDGSLVQRAKIEYTVACNWKFLVENHVDVYHLSHLHHQSLGAYAHRRFEWETLSGNWWSYEPLKTLVMQEGPQSAASSPEAPSGAPGLPWLSARERGGIGAHLLFPNLMMVTTQDYFATYDAVPLSPDRTHLTLRVRADPDADGEYLVEQIRKFLSEDVVICERLQSAVASPGFEVGPLARTHEEPILRFHRTLRDRLRS